MLQVVSTGAYYPPVDTTWKILTTGASQLTAGALCTVVDAVDDHGGEEGGQPEHPRPP